MIELFHRVRKDCSRITTQRYSTSFSSAIRLLHEDLDDHVEGLHSQIQKLLTVHDNMVLVEFSMASQPYNI